jgi:tetratricopeptide (TPR) repeat protein
LANLEGPDQFTAAILDFQSSDSKIPSGRAKAAAGYCLTCTDQPHVAAQFYERAIKSGFDTPAVRNNLGYCCLKRADSKSARVHFDVALNMEPNLAVMHHNRALLFWLEARRTGQSKKEIDDLVLLGIAAAKKAALLGHASPELQFDTARLYALAAQSDPSMIEPAADHLRAALAGGYDRRKDTTFAHLRNSEPFKNLAGLQPGPEQPIAPRYVDPIR